MNVNADALSRNPIANEEKSRNLHEDDEDTLMASQEKLFNDICNNFLKYTSLLKILASKLLL